MKKTYISLTIFLIVLFTMTFIQKSYASIILSFEPATQDVVPGNQAVVNIVISGLGDYDSPSVGAFDFDVIYDPTVLIFNSYELGGFLGDILSGEAVDISLGKIAPGDINIAELSLLSILYPDFLIYFQPSSFTLATLYFDTIAYGSSYLEFYFDIYSSISDEYGSSLDVTLQSGTVNVVPEPTTLLLMGAGFAGLGFYRKRKRIN